MYNPILKNYKYDDVFIDGVIAEMIEEVKK